ALFFFGTTPGSFSESDSGRLLASVPPPDRLSALDAAFLDLETAQAPLHVGWTLKLEGPAPSVAALRRQIDARLDALPRFRRCVDGQQWVDDPGFDVARHVHGMTLAAPGGPGELRALAGRLLGSPLDMDRPLWRLARIDGLAGGGWAIVGQAHHALVDGVAAVQVAMLLFDGVEARPAPWRAAATGRGPSRRSSRSTRAPASPRTSATTSRSSPSTCRCASAIRSPSCAWSATARARPRPAVSRARCAPSPRRPTCSQRP